MFTDKLMSSQNYESVEIDLSGVRHIDSTNIGIIAKTAGKFLETKNIRIVVHAANDNIQRVLTGSSLDLICRITGEKLQGELCWEEIPSGIATREETGRMVLEAHETLMNVNDANRKIYSDVIELLQKSVYGKKS